MATQSVSVAVLNSYLAAVRIAHEAIYDLHAELASPGTAGGRAAKLLADSVRITFDEVPALTADFHNLAHTWHEQTVLDPAAAGETERQLAAEVTRLKPHLQRHLDRQREIARELQRMIGGAG